jgi:hypothetical protein
MMATHPTPADTNEPTAPREELSRSGPQSPSDPNPSTPPTSGGVTRRQFIVGGSVVAVAVAAGCGSGAISGRDDGGSPDGGSPDGGSPDGGAPDGGAPDGTVGDGPVGNQAPVWTTIPDQVWVVGVPVNLDLASYCSDPDGDALTYTLSAALPDGVTLTGSVISGTPTGVFAAASFTATADDGQA